MQLIRTLVLETHGGAQIRITHRRCMDTSHAGDETLGLAL
jgi:hypothetical protein